MPKDIKREFLTGPRKFDEIMEKLEIIVNEMMADDGPVPMDLGNVGMHDAKMTQRCEDVCAIAWKKYKAGLSRRDGTRTEYSECELSRGLQMAVTMHPTFKSEWRGPQRWCRAPGEVLMENKVARTHLRSADFERWSLSEGCPGCRYLRTVQGQQQTHSEACPRRVEGLLKGDSVGFARLAAGDERISRALLDAVERHVTKDPGTRGLLKRASVVCHPESEPQKKIALDTGLDATPFSLMWRIISIRCATQHHHKHRPEHRRDSNKQRGSHWWRCRDEGRRCKREQWEVTRAQRDQTAEGGSQRKGNHAIEHH